MIADFEDNYPQMFVIIDDIWQEASKLFTHPGPQSACSDSELITLAIVSECKGWDKETELCSEWRNYRHLFPHLPERSRFNRRRRRLMSAINVVRQKVLEQLDVAIDRQCVIDSLPVPIIPFSRAWFSRSRSEWTSYGASYGYVSSKKQTIFGYKLHLLMTLNGVILDFELVGANESDLVVGLEILQGHQDLEVLGDKAYISAAGQSELERSRRVSLRTLPRLNQKKQVSREYRHLFNHYRQVVESVNGQLSDQFNVEINHAHSAGGLFARLHTKLLAHTICIYLNYMLGKADFRQIKSLAFPI